ncbi:hypothetical protein JL720_1213 [Aureococcus anophagefferens]|nr:hypothetical protein JL720_1213 [Aureococcus anophagefferens]
MTSSSNVDDVLKSQQFVIGGTSRPELNGKVVYLIGNPGGGRLRVKLLEAPHTEYALKAEHLKQLGFMHTLRQAAGRLDLSEVRKNLKVLWRRPLVKLGLGVLAIAVLSSRGGGRARAKARPTRFGAHEEFSPATPRRTALRAAKEVDTSRWEYYAKHPMARGAKLGAGACRVFYAEWRARRHARKSRDEGGRRAVERGVADLLIALGPTYVKLGQIASCRKELEKTPWAAALQRLQDDVHLGVLRNGTRVAVKVQRPALREIYDRDVTLLRKMFAFLDRRKWKVGVEQKWLDIFDDAAALLYREIDYRVEASHCERFRSDFSGVPWVAAPAVYPELSGETVLTMEYLPGAYFLQFCKHRFFNTDPHAGNLAADGGFAPGGRLIFYDFGQAARSADEALALRAPRGHHRADAAKTVDAFERMGVVKNGFDRAAVEATIASNFRSGLMQGVGLALDSEFEFIAASAPLVAELAIEEKGVATYLQDELKKKLKLG